MSHSGNAAKNLKTVYESTRPGRWSSNVEAFYENIKFGKNRNVGTPRRFRSPFSFWRWWSKTCGLGHHTM